MTQVKEKHPDNNNVLPNDNEEVSEKTIFLKNFNKFYDIFSQSVQDFDMSRKTFMLVKFFDPRIIIPTLSFHYFYRDSQILFNTILFFAVILLGVIAYHIPKRYRHNKAKTLRQDYCAYVMDNITPRDNLYLSTRYDIPSFQIRNMTFKEFFDITGPIHIEKSDMTRKERAVYRAIMGNK